MIRVIDLPQRSNNVLTYETSGHLLTITLNGITEVFDFSDLPDGYLEGVEVDLIQYNPIVNGLKKDGILELEILRPYSEEEKHIYEEPSEEFAHENQEEGDLLG